MRSVTVLAVSCLLIVGLAGCIGGQDRTEWAYDITQLDAAAATGLSGKGVRVGVLDTGINTAHSSLDHLVDGNDANGELKGYRDYLTNNHGLQYAHDESGHGTHVIGIMAARGSSFSDKLLYGGVDLLGGSPSIQLYVATVCGQLEDGTEGCSIPAIRRALEWMGSQNVDVVSLSLGGELGLDLLLTDGPVQAINDLIDDGVVVVAAAGNDGPNNGDVSEPADIAGVIAVGAITKDGRVWDKSNRGDSSANTCTDGGIFGQFGRCAPNQKPELVAPGVGILSAWSGDAYVIADGTSQATPFVTSAVALMLEGKSRLTTRADVLDVKDVLMDTARRVQGQSLPHDDAAGYGIVQAMDAVRAY